jgi:hypothetical protein
MIDLKPIMDYLLKGPGGNLASIIGLFVSILGFVITISNTRKSKTAAEEARDAVVKVRTDLSKIETVSDLSIAITLMEEIKRLQMQSSWMTIPDRCSNLRKNLISIKSNYPNLSIDQKTALQNAIQQFTTIETLVVKALNDNKSPTDPLKLYRIVSLQVDNAYQLLIDIRNTVGL